MLRESYSMKWCEHIKFSKESCNYNQRQVGGMKGCWLMPFKRKMLTEENFCPICGVKRPERELTLAEKFTNCISNQQSFDVKKLEEIAREHYLTKLVNTTFEMGNVDYWGILEEIKEKLFESEK